MKKRNSILARLLAALALIAVVVAVFLIVSDGLKNESSNNKSGQNHPAKQKHRRPRTKAKVYVVQPGDTLSSIAHETGVSVAELQKLNPEVDPQILTVGEELKLR